MKIWLNETTIATQNVKRLADFYSGLLGEKGELEHRDFFYTIKDLESQGQLSMVPHNGDKKWDQPWVSLSTDDLPNAIIHLKELGVSDDHIESFGPVDENDNPVHGVCFRDPDGRLMMMMSESSL
jgi:catechol 2,3-dioxygenase-like lactoylglutathione lyase family enzyme